MILAVKLFDLNQMDYMDITVDEYDNTIVFTKSVDLNENDTMFVKIYESGFASFGYAMKSDPLHNNCPYVWSSNPEAINENLGLIGTEWELAKWTVGVNNDPTSCSFCYGILKSLALKIGEANQDQMKHGLFEFYKRYASKIEIVEPKEGIQLTKKTHNVKNGDYFDKYVECSDGRWMKIDDLYEWYINKHHSWCLGEILGTIL